MFKQWVAWGSLFLLLFVVMGAIDFSPFEKTLFFSNFMANSEFIKTFLSVFILFLVAFILFVGAINKKYSFKVEQLNFGGLNVLFNNSDALYKGSLKNYLNTKRSLFLIKPNLDSFEEVFNSYYEIYKFIRVEMRVLNVKRKDDKKLYEKSNEMLKRLNLFLTKHQNNYRRWHKYVSDNDQVMFINDKNEKIFLTYHMTPIGKVQEKYYHFNKLISDFQDINSFFSNDVAPIFGIDCNKWRENA